MDIADRLSEAAQTAGLAEDHFTLEILPGGIRIKLIREYPHGNFNPFPRHYAFENFTAWQSIKRATKNPLLSCLRDLSNQANEFRP